MVYRNKRENANLIKAAIGLKLRMNAGKFTSNFLKFFNVLGLIFHFSIIPSLYLTGITQALSFLSKLPSNKVNWVNYPLLELATRCKTVLLMDPVNNLHPNSADPMVYLRFIRNKNFDELSVSENNSAPHAHEASFPSRIGKSKNALNS